MTPADDELRDGLAEIIRIGCKTVTVLSPKDVAELVVAELRRRGAWLPGSEVTDEMVKAGERALLDAYRSQKATTSGLVAREVVTAALNARKP